MWLVVGYAPPSYHPTLRWRILHHCCHLPAASRMGLWLDGGRGTTGVERVTTWTFALDGRCGWRYWNIGPNATVLQTVYLPVLMDVAEPSPLDACIATRPCYPTTTLSSTSGSRSCIYSAPGPFIYLHLYSGPITLLRWTNRQIWFPTDTFHSRVPTTRCTTAFPLPAAAACHHMQTPYPTFTTPYRFCRKPSHLLWELGGSGWCHPQGRLSGLVVGVPHLHLRALLHVASMGPSPHSPPSLDSTLPPLFMGTPPPHTTFLLPLGDRFLVSHHWADTRLTLMRQDPFVGFYRQRHPHSGVMQSGTNRNAEWWL